MITAFPNPEPSQVRSTEYAILIQDLMTPTLLEWFDEFTITQTAAGETLLTGPVADQSALHGLLARVRDLNLTLISVNRIEPKERQP